MLTVIDEFTRESLAIVVARRLSSDDVLAALLCQAFRTIPGEFGAGTPVPGGKPPRSGRIEARIGLRMMPPFPRSPLTFRKASFPRYG
jgi:hypothetical protein